MARPFDNFKGTEEHINRLSETAIAERLREEYLNINFPLIIYGDLYFYELEHCQPLKEHIQSMGFRFEYNSRKYIFFLEIHQQFNNVSSASLIQINPMSVKSISEEDIVFILRKIVKKYIPKRNINFQNIKHKPISDSRRIISTVYRIKNGGQLDPTNFKNDIEYFFSKEFGQGIGKKIQVNFTDIQLKTMIRCKLNPEKIKTAQPHTGITFLKYS
jgi:hypothetical protein